MPKTRFFGWFIAFAAAFLVAGIVASFSEIATADQPKCYLSNTRLTESSGVCVGNRDREVWWTHNDSGDEPRLFAFHTDGQALAEVRIVGARAIDWEDICSFRVGETAYLAIGDVGDNNARRDSIEIYIVKEPKLEPVAKNESGPPKIDLPVSQTLHIAYPTGPVNCEGLAYDSSSKSLVLATKELLRCRLFEVGLQLKIDSVEGPDGVEPPATSDNLEDGDFERTAKPIGSLLFPMVTGADIQADGMQLVLCSYGPGCLIKRNPRLDQIAPQETDGEKGDIGQVDIGLGSLAPASQESKRSPVWKLDVPEDLQIFDLPIRKQGEAICFARSQRQFLLTSEFEPTPLFVVDVPDASKAGEE